MSMKLAIPTSMSIEKIRSVEFPDLEQILENATDEVSYLPTQNGFLLLNEALRIEYVESGLIGKDLVGLWFRTKPPVYAHAVNVDMGKLPNSLRCDCIAVYLGDGYLKTAGAPTITLYRDSQIPDLGGDKEWFNTGTKLLQKAAGKYNLKKWYEFYKSNGSPEETKSLIQRIRKYLPST